MTSQKDINKIAEIISSQGGFAFCKDPACKECRAVKSYKEELVKDLTDYFGEEGFFNHDEHGCFTKKLRKKNRTQFLKKCGVQE